MLFAGPAASEPAAGPVMTVGWRLTAVGGKRPPNIVETRIAGKGTLQFDNSPVLGVSELADNETGRIVVEYDVLTPRPRTVQLTLKVTRAFYLRSRGQEIFFLDVQVIRSDDGEGEQVETCRVGAKGKLVLATSAIKSGYRLDLSDCGIAHGQQAANGKNSPVQLTTSPKCLRGPAARKPLCGKKPATTTFRLVKTEVKNADPANMTINGTAGTARWECCPGGAMWKSSFTFKVPKTLVPGQKAQVSLGLTIESVEPRQALQNSISVSAPGLREELFVQYLEQPSRSATYTFPISAGEKSASELVIVIGLPQGQVIYRYRK